MDLAAYFKEIEGVGILGTCDPQNQVDLALYSKPVVIDDQTVALVMKQRHSHQNLQQNLKAAYLFLEKGPGYKGLRMHLTVLREEKNQSLIESLRKQQPCMFPQEDDSAKYLVYFTVNKVRPLIGDGDM
ncbi:MAG: pyridoxamine 5'-phosphate oxidase family protein [Planctomycetota bacterium]|jgi:hypothetical protein